MAAIVVHGEFEWDDALLDPLSLDVGDATDPSRIVTLGMGASRVLYVVSTDRADRIRVISARKANRHELRTYQEAP